MIMIVVVVPGPQSKMPPSMTKMRVCSGCDVTGQKSKVCSNCKVDHYCSPECQLAHWPVHSRLCTPQIKNRRMMKKLQKAAVRVLDSTEYERLRQNHPSHTLMLQYVGANDNPSDEFLVREMHIAMKYAECVNHPVICLLPPHSSTMQGVLRPTPENRRSYGGCYMELSAWVGKDGSSITGGIVGSYL
jgi:hypothetical protein